MQTENELKPKNDMKPERSELEAAESVWTKRRPCLCRTFELGSPSQAMTLGSSVYQVASGLGALDVELSVQGTKLWMQISPAKSNVLTKAVNDLTAKIDVIYQYMSIETDD